MSLTIHQSGIDAAINAQADGFSGVTLNRVDLYNGNTKIKPLDLEGVQVIEPGRIYVVAQDSSADSYDVTKMQFYTSANELFATAQNADNSVIQSKAANSTLLLTHQLNLSTAPGTVAPSGDVSIYMPHATESLLGGAEIATQAEVDAGTDDIRFVTSKKLKNMLLSFVRNATETVKGFLEIATQDEVNSGTDHSRAVTPKTLKSRLSSFVRNATESARGFIEIATQAETIAGSDNSRAITPLRLKQWWIDLDLELSWSAITGKPNTYPPSAHNHRIIGRELYFFTDDTPEPGFLSLDGSTIPNGVNDYAALAASGSRYITISGNDIILADASDVIRGKGSSDRAVGEFQGDAIRNIEGVVGAVYGEAAFTPSGAFYIDGAAGFFQASSSGFAWDISKYDASRVVPTAPENRVKSLTADIRIYYGES